MASTRNLNLAHNFPDVLKMGATGSVPIDLPNHPGLTPAARRMVSKLLGYNELDDDAGLESVTDTDDGRDDPNHVRYVYLESLLEDPGVSRAVDVLLKLNHEDEEFDKLITRVTKFALPLIRERGPNLVKRLGDQTIRSVLATHLLNRHGNRMGVGQWAAICNYRRAQYNQAMQDIDESSEEAVFLKHKTAVTYAQSFNDLFQGHPGSAYSSVALRVDTRDELTRYLDDEGERGGDIVRTIHLPITANQVLRAGADGYPQITITTDSEVRLEDRSPGWVENAKVMQAEDVVTIMSNADVVLHLEFQKA